MLWELFTVSSTCHVSVNTCTLNKSKSTSAGLRFDSSFIFSVNFLILNSQIFFIQCLFHARASFLRTFLMYEELFHVSQSMFLHEKTHVITREWSKRKIPSGLGKFCEHVAWFSDGPGRSQPRTLSPRATWTGESGYWRKTGHSYNLSRFRVLMARGNIQMFRELFFSGPTEKKKWMLSRSVVMRDNV